MSYFATGNNTAIKITKSVNFLRQNVEEKDINFFDYDGTLVASYNISSLPLSSLPVPTVHSNLVFQGWNFTLTEVNNLTQKTDIGAMYKTSSGDTELDIKLTTVTGLDTNISLYKVDSGTMTIDWGDSTTSTSTDTSLISFSHTYAEARNYTIKVQFNGSYYFRNSITANFLSTSANAINYSLIAVRFSEYVSQLYSNCFNRCFSLETVTMTNNISYLGGQSFYFCYSLKAITIPNSVDSLLTNTFAYCQSLTNITVSSSVNSIGSGVFRSAINLKRLTFFNVNFGGSTTFLDTYSITTFNFSNTTTIPELANINNFEDINGICEILVPSALYDDWIIATNWSTYANYIKAV